MWLATGTRCNGTSIPAALTAETGISCYGVIMSDIHATGICAAAEGAKDRAVGSRGDGCAWLLLCRLPYPAANPASPSDIVPYLQRKSRNMLA